VRQPHPGAALPRRPPRPGTGGLRAGHRHRHPLVRRPGRLGPQRRGAVPVHHRRHRADVAEEPPRGAAGQPPAGSAGGGVVNSATASAWRSRLLRVVSPLALLALWQLLTSWKVTLWLRFEQFPTVVHVVEKFRSRLTESYYWQDLADSLSRIVTGFALA